MTNPLIRTPHGVEWVEAVVQYAEDESNWPEVCNAWTLHINPENSDKFDALKAIREEASGNIIKVRRDINTSGNLDWRWFGRDVVNPGQWLVCHLDNTVSAYDTDPRIEPEWEWRAVLEHGTYETDEETARVMARPIMGGTLESRPVYRWDGWTLTGDWEEVE